MSGFGGGGSGGGAGGATTVQIATQAQTYARTPYLGGSGKPLVPSITNLLVGQQAVQAAFFNVASDGAVAGLGSNAIDLQGIRAGGKASGANSAVFGHACSATTPYSCAVGYACNATTGNAGSAFGHASNSTALLANAFGTANAASGAKSSAFGYKCTASAKYSSSFGYYNRSTGAGRASAFGYGNQSSGYGSSAFGYKCTANNNKASAFGYSCTASNFSCAFGQSCTASGTGSVSIGYSCSSTAANSLSFGFGSHSTTAGSSAFGYNALARISNTSVIQGPIIAPKTGVVAQANAFAQLSGVQDILWTVEIDFTAVAATYTFTLPAGARFFIDEVGVIVEELDGSVTTQPTYEFGITGTNAKYLNPIIGANLNTLLQRDRYSILKADVGESTLTFTITVAGVRNTATVYKGKAYFKGMLIELEP